MLIRSLPLVVNFDAFHLADVYLTQPVLLVVEEDAGSRWHTEKLHKMIGGASQKVVVPKGTHMDFYNREHFVGLAVREVSKFVKAKLH